MDESGSYHRLNGATLAAPSQVAIDAEVRVLTSSHQEDAEGIRDGVAGGNSVGGEGIEEEERKSVTSESSEEVDEHRLLSVNYHGGKSNKSAHCNLEEVTRINMPEGVSWDDEAIDPFSPYPPRTKLDYLKVSINMLRCVYL